MESLPFSCFTGRVWLYGAASEIYGTVVVDLLIVSVCFAERGHVEHGDPALASANEFYTRSQRCRSPAGRGQW